MEGMHVSARAWGTFHNQSQSITYNRHDTWGATARTVLPMNARANSRNEPCDDPPNFGHSASPEISPLPRVLPALLWSRCSSVRAHGGLVGSGMSAIGKGGVASSKKERKTSPHNTAWHVRRHTARTHTTRIHRYNKHGHAHDARNIKPQSNEK